VSDPADDSVPTIPPVIVPEGLSDYLAVMTRAVFQTGLSWRQIALHWGAYVRAFDGFDCARVAAYGEIEIERVLETPGVLHSPRKIAATVKNARALLDLDRADGGFAAYLRGFPSYAALAKDLKRHFTFMGEMNAWYFLFRVGEPVPAFDVWVTTIPGDHPRMREMVDQARG
jgi:hypothetical protein